MNNKSKVNIVLSSILSLCASFETIKAEETSKRFTVNLNDLKNNNFYEGKLKRLDNSGELSNNLKEEQNNAANEKLSKILDNSDKVSGDLKEKDSGDINKKLSKVFTSETNKSKAEKSAKLKKNKFFPFIFKGLKKIASTPLKLGSKFLRSLAHRILFFGVKDDNDHIKNMKNRFDVEEVIIDWKANGSKNGKIKLHGYTFKPKSKESADSNNNNNDDYDTVCICFGSDMNPCHRMVTENSYDRILYVCIDYPTFGSSEYLYLDENKMLAFDDFIYDYVSSKYKDKKLIALGFSLGGFGASYMSQKERISEVYLVSPVYLPGIIGKKSCDYLFGYELSFIKNLENCNHKCNVYIISGGKSDFLSLYYTLIYYFYDKLPAEQNINKQIENCIKLLEINKNLVINCQIEHEFDHYNIYAHAVKEFYRFFSNDSKNGIQKNTLIESEQNNDKKEVKLVA